MNRFFLTALAGVAFATASAQAVTMSVDGSLSDWISNGLLRSDPATDGTTSNGGIEMLRYGATIQNNSSGVLTFFAAIEINKPLSDFNGAVDFGTPEVPNLVNRTLYPGAFIDVDRNKGTTLQKWNDGGYTGALEGTDINIEWGRHGGEGSAGQDLNYWGAEDDLWKAVAGGIPGGAVGESENSLAHGVLEWSAPVANIISTITSLPDGVTAGSNWKVRLGIQGNYRDYGKGSATGYDWSIMHGDADWSNTTDVDDLTALLSNYDKTGKAWADGDFDGNNTVNVDDLTALLSNYDKTNDVVVPAGGPLPQGVVNTVPEPSSIVMLTTLSALISAWVIRRRAR
jgi:hypothetical protein